MLYNHMTARQGDCFERHDGQARLRYVVLDYTSTGVYAAQLGRSGFWNGKAKVYPFSFAELNASQYELLDIR